MATSKKIGSSSESSDSSSDSEAEITGQLKIFFFFAIYNLSYVLLLKKPHHICFSGMIKQRKKKSQPVKEGKKTHPPVQAGSAQTGLPSQILGPQSSSQMKNQPPPASFVAAPPVAALESSHLLESYESLPPFSSHQPIMHMPHHTGNSSPAPPHLNAHPAGPVSPETHPFLNQHPILPSPGMCRYRRSTFDSSISKLRLFYCFCKCDCNLSHLQLVH